MKRITRVWGWLIMGSVIAPVVATIAGWHFMGPQDGEPAAPTRKFAVNDVPPPRRSESPFRNTDPSVEYIGSARCLDCHTAEHASYLHTAHSRSLSRLDADTPLPDADFVHSPSRHRYRVYREAGELRHRESLLLDDGQELELYDYPIHWAIGSGRFGHSYATEVDGFLVQSPVSWYSDREAWGMSPGYDQRSHLSFLRTISTECLFCHAGAVESIDESDFSPRIVETAIGCERCHGPGALHVELRSSGWHPEPNAPWDNTIVNPAKLDRHLAEAICQQCHLQSDAHVLVRGRSLDDFRPGLPLEDVRLEFRRQELGSEMTIVGHAEQLQHSRCYVESETLTCTTCHQMHARTSPELELPPYRSACLQCHQQESCGKPLSERLELADDDCLRCHMPQVPTEIPHVAFTQHRIGVHDLDSGGTKAVLTDTLATWQDLSRLAQIDQERSRGLAWLQLARDSDDLQEHRRLLARSEQILQGVYRRGLRDPSVTAALADIAWKKGDTQAAEKLALQTLAAVSTPTEERITALGLLGELYFRRNESAKALGPLRQVVRYRRDARRWCFLGLCEQNAGDTDRAIESLQKSLEIAPQQVAAAAALAVLYRVRGENELAEEHERWAETLRKTGLTDPISR